MSFVSRIFRWKFWDLLRFLPFTSTVVVESQHVERILMGHPRTVRKHKSNSLKFDSQPLPDAKTTTTNLPKLKSLDHFGKGLVLCVNTDEDSDLGRREFQMKCLKKSNGYNSLMPSVQLDSLTPHFCPSDIKLISSDNEWFCIERYSISPPLHSEALIQLYNNIIHPNFGIIPEHSCSLHAFLMQQFE